MHTQSMEHSRGTGEGAKVVHRGGGGPERRGVDGLEGQSNDASHSVSSSVTVQGAHGELKGLKPVREVCPQAKPSGQ